MTARLPGPTKTHWILSEKARAIGELVAAAIAGAGLLCKAASDPTAADVWHGFSGSLLLAAAGILALAVNGALRVAAAAKKDRDASDKNDPQHLLAPLRVLYALVAKKKNIVGDDDEEKLLFRVTLHRNIEAPADRSGSHQQVVQYVGGKAPGKKRIVGRTWPNHCGLVGKVIRSGEVKRVQLSETVDTEAKYRKELIDLYGYTEDQAHEMQPMRLDALAIPIKSDGQVVGVVYADSSSRNFFDDDTVNLCVQVTGAIAQHIETTYTGG